jgi:hypothetical protein
LNVGKLFGALLQTISSLYLQCLGNESSDAKRPATESSSSARQGAGNVKSEAERKMEETAAQHKGQADGNTTEEIEKAKRKAQESGH